MQFSHQPNETPWRKVTRIHPILASESDAPSMPSNIAQTICECLDGGSGSCIGSDWIISADKMHCAARIVLRDLHKEAITALSASIPFELKDIWQILHILETKYHIMLPSEIMNDPLLIENPDRKKVLSVISHAIQNMDPSIVRANLLHKLTVWDKITMNSGADWNYHYSIAGSQGVIESIEGDNVRVNFSYLAWAPWRTATYEVDIHYMDLLEIWKGVRDVWRRIAKRINTIGSPAFSDIEIWEIHKKVQSIAESVLLQNYSIKNSNLSQENLADLMLQTGLLVPHAMQVWSYALNRNDLLRHAEPTVYAAYRNPNLYSPSGSEVPPAERKPGTIAFELAQWCSYGRCTFCELYGDTSFNVKTPVEFQNHIDRVIEAIGPSAAWRIRRAFIGWGNALSVDLDTLVSSVKAVNNTVHPHRIAVYGATAAILKKGERWLKQLSRAGLGMIYLGVESGSDEVLRYIRKWASAETVKNAASLVKGADIELSVTIMLGVWGERLSYDHAIQTAKLLNEIDSEYITFLTTTTSGSTPYDKTMAAETKAWTNQLLTNKRIVHQLRLIIENLEPRWQKIGMFGEETHSAGSNPIVFRETFTRWWKRDILHLCDEYLGQ